MISRVVVSVALIALLATACSRADGGGPGAAKSAQQQAQEALQRVAASSSNLLGITPPSNLPRFAAPMPDGFLTAASQGSPTPSAGEIEYATAATPEVVAEFYKALAARHGLKVEADKRSDAKTEFAASGGGRKLKVTAEPEEGFGSTVRLTYG